MRLLHAVLFLLFGSLAIGAQESAQTQSVTTQPKVVEAIAPDYPEAASSLRAEGRVAVAVRINPNGVVDSAKALWGPHIFVQPAIAAARRWRFVESKDRQKRAAELAFVFWITDKPEESRVSFIPPNQMEIVVHGPSRYLGVVRPTYGEDDGRPQVIRSVAPVYPPLAKMVRGASGTVKVEVRIDDKGKVVRASVKEGHPLLQASAATAARQWEFALSASKEERLVTLTFVFIPTFVQKDTRTSFVSPYQVEIVASPPHIDTNYTVTRTETVRH